MARSAALAGLLSVVLFTLVAFGVELITIPGGEDDNARYAFEIVKEDNQIRSMVGIYAAIAGVLAYAWFASYLVRRIADAGAARELPEIGRGLLLIGVALSIAGLATFAAMPLSLLTNSEVEPITPDIARTAWVGNALLFMVAPVIHACVIAVVSLGIFQTKAFPVWTAWLGALCSALLLSSLAWVPLLAMPLWIVCLSVVLLLRSERKPQRSIQTAPSLS